MSKETSRNRTDEIRRELAQSVRSCTVEQFHQQMIDAGVLRAFLVYENGEFSLSHPKLLRPLRAFLELSHDFARHEGIFIGREEGIPTLFFAFVHDTRRGLSQGGLRFTKYPNLADLLSDGIRLSQGMTRKNSLAGLWWGGGKGIVPLPPGYERPEHVTDPEERRRIFEAYGRFIAGLGGVYYTAEDVGTKTADMDAILSQNRFVTCISRTLGGSGNPSPFTARGVFRALQAAWLLLEKTDRLEGVRVAVQGAGNVGSPLIDLLDDAGARVWVCDVNEAALARLQQQRPRVQIVPTDQIFDLDVDVFAPCARGGEVNQRTIPRLKVRLVCGAANNILEEPEDAERLRQRGILFVPDYVCNRMGITNCADEWLGYLQEDVRLAAERVYPDTMRVLKHAHQLGVTTVQAADQLADIAASELHPLIGHRGRRIIDHLMESGWHDSGRKKKRGEVRASSALAFDPSLDEPGIRLTWEKDGRFQGTGPAVAAAPISTSSRPHLASFLSPLLMDVRARAQEKLTGRRPRRVAGSDHGGLALQLAVEWSLPHERQAVGRPELVELCQDAHSRNDAAIRDQLHQLGIGFDPRAWLDPMEERVGTAVERLFHALSDAGLVVRENRLEHRCPRCESVLVSSDIKRSKLDVHERFTLRFPTRDGGELETVTFSPEHVIGTVAIAVRLQGRFGALAGSTTAHPLSGRPLPVVAEKSLGVGVDAELLVPSCSERDARIARLHGLAEAPAVFDDRSLVRLPDGRAVPVDEARREVLARLGECATREEGRWRQDVRRCGRCETIVTPDSSPQLFVHVERLAEQLRQRIENGTVHFSTPHWQERVLAYLGALEPWCISRQYWWGNEVPKSSGDDKEEVFSTWFSLAAWTLCGNGWPEQAFPEPVEDVFVDPDWLLRWVVPSQLLSLAVTGRPAFRRVHVHGAVHVLDRKLSPLSVSPADAHDEERYVARIVRRPMRRNLGNIVEPGSLVRRFGADVLRLGYLLALGVGDSEAITLAETHLRRARRAVRTLVSKVTGLFSMVREPLRVGEPRQDDLWIVAHCARAGQDALRAYEDHLYGRAAEILVTTVDAFARYANAAAERRRADSDLGAVRGATTLAVGEMAAAFSPICPYLFEKLERWTVERCPAPAERDWTAPPLEDPAPTDAVA
jgi:valyl-tRNA synthetase/glutamate dehydrogenase/leucine dehydrogenase